MIGVLLIATDYIIDMRNVVFWVGTITAIITLIMLVVKPVRQTLKSYNEALESTKNSINRNTQAINTLTDIQEKQSKCISDIKNDRRIMLEDMEKIQHSLVTMARLELDKELTKALNRGYITHSRLGWIEEMYLIYEPHCHNGSIKSSLLRVRQLPIGNEEGVHDD